MEGDVSGTRRAVQRRWVVEYWSEEAFSRLIGSGYVDVIDLPSEYLRVAFSLGSFPNPKLFRKAMDEIMEGMKRWGFVSEDDEAIAKMKQETMEEIDRLRFAPRADSGAVGEEAAAAEDEEGTMEIFFAYAREDETLRDELEKHLSILERQGVITSWHDRKIGAGKEWEGEIDTHLKTARVILLLVSSDFMDSDYCWDVEVKRAMERHEAGEARVIPVILRPVDWKGAPFGKLQALPTDAKPVTTWTNQDQAFLDVARGIRTAVMELRVEDNDSAPNHENPNS